MITKINKPKNTYIYDYKCDVCGNEDSITKGHLDRAKENGTKVCNTCTSKKLKRGINDIPTTAPWMIPYFQGGIDEASNYMKSSGKKIFFKCPFCGRIKDKQMTINKLYHKKKLPCICSDGKSFPEKFMYSCLEQLGLDFVTEYSPDWIKPMRYDFYIPHKNMIIEMDGGLGHGKKSFGKKEDVVRSKEVDEYKNKAAKENNIDIVRIISDKSSKEYLRDQIINSRAFSDSEIEKINFSLAEEFATSNLIKTVCESYIDLNKTPTVELSKKFKMGRGTIIKYLTIGTKLGWCEYDSKKAMIENARKNGKLHCIPIEICQEVTGITKTYESATELAKCSEKDFGVKLVQATISRKIREGEEFYKGFRIRKIDFN